MPAKQVYLWKKTPFLRLLLPFVTGIICQFYLQFSFFLILAAVTLSLAVLFFWRFVVPALQYRLLWITGLAINLWLIAGGAMVVYSSAISNHENWIGSTDTGCKAILVCVDEDPVEKTKTFKAEATITGVQYHGAWKPAVGRVLIYFTKGVKAGSITYGSKILFSKSLRKIENSGNPGNFDYRQYNAFKDIYHQVFLKDNDFVIAGEGGSVFKKWLLRVRDSVLKILSTYIRGRDEAAVAEALLIGYRNDLDRDLVQAYSNTGVVHIIAISGLHLGMIYLSLVFVFKLVQSRGWVRWIRPLVILVVLWLFTLLAGSVPSILRAAVMFTFIVVGEMINRKTSIYNTLAASAFVLLCFNPFYLWDVGFQLSYAAVISIVTFFKPVYSWFYIRNKSIDFFWKLTAVTISAQVLTLPIIFYSFHQFPNLFLITNCLIVPLSTVILFAELALVSVFWVPHIGNVAGLITEWLIGIMNDFINWINRFPFAVYDGISFNLPQVILLYLFLIGISWWLLRKNKGAFYIGLCSLSALLVIDTFKVFNTGRRGSLVVYNIAQHAALDFVSGEHFAFYGDSVFRTDGYLRNFHLKPARTLFGVKPVNNLPHYYVSKPFAWLRGARILVIDKPYRFKAPARMNMDVIVLCHNSKVSITALQESFDCGIYVADASNSRWKMNQWKKECEGLHLRFHSVAEEGAYVRPL